MHDDFALARELFAWAYSYRADMALVVALLSAFFTWRTYRHRVTSAHRELRMSGSEKLSKAENALARSTTHITTIGRARVGLLHQLEHRKLSDSSRRKAHEIIGAANSLTADYDRISKDVEREKKSRLRNNATALEERVSRCAALALAAERLQSEAAARASNCKIHS